MSHTRHTHTHTAHALVARAHAVEAIQADYDEVTTTGGPRNATHAQTFVLTRAHTHQFSVQNYEAHEARGMAEPEVSERGGYQVVRPAGVSGTY